MTKPPDKQIPTWWQQPQLRRFMESYSRPGASALLFIGSGLSISAGLPNWKELLLTLAQDHDNACKRNPIHSQVESLLIDGQPSRGKYQDAGSLVEAAFRDDLNEEVWRATLKGILNRDLPLKSEIHDIVAKLTWSRIITTNYDILLERAAQKTSRYANVKVTHPWSPDFDSAMKSDTAQPYIVKIHGDIDDDKSKLVLSKEVFDDLYHDAGSASYRLVLGHLFHSATVILFLGYSHDDPYLQELFAQQMHQVRRESTFAIVPKEGDLVDFEDRTHRLSRNMRMNFITYSLDNRRPNDRHHELRELLEYIADPTSYDSKIRELYHIRKPTVVILHCGGTIGSEPSSDKKDRAEEPLKVIAMPSRYDKRLQDFSRKVLRWYESSYNAGEAFHIDLLEEVLSEDNQMFSENATPELWNALQEKLQSIIFKYFEAPALAGSPLSSDHPLEGLFTEENASYRSAHGGEELTELRFLSDFTNRYIMGIVVLFGTDTLAYAASAMGLGIQHLPCPIVITGANQPPQEKDPGEFYATSDAWTNLSTSLYFLQCFGHRLTEVFVCFGDTIHNSINLRKMATEIIPSGRPWFASQYSEPFAYRNLSLHAQYMFKSIDGIFCNNYYPRTVHYFSMISDRDEFNSFRHIRFDALDGMQKTIVVDQFSPRVAAVDVSPGFPPIDVAELVRCDIRAVLVEGYPSGTFPSHRNSRFTGFMKACKGLGIPLVLISRYGTLASQHGYKVEEDEDGPIRVLPLYGIIAETALPLLSLVVKMIDDKKWLSETLDGRIDLLQSTINDIFRLRPKNVLSRPNILSLELENITNRVEMANTLRKAQEESARKHGDREKQYLERGPFPSYARILQAKRRLERYSDSSVILPERDILLILEEFAQIFEKVQAEPEGFETVFNLGFNVGVPLWNSFRMAQANVDLESTSAVEGAESLPLRFFFEIGADERRVRLEQANTILSQVSRLLDAIGVTRTVNRRIGAPELDDTTKRQRPRSMRLSVSAYRFPREAQSIERYAVMTFSENERLFFLSLSHGATDGTDLSKLYNELLEQTWRHSTRTMDWLVLGLFKGASCGAANFLRLDDLAFHGGDDRNLGQHLRKRVKTNIESIDGPTLRVSYDYVGRVHPEDEPGR